MKATITAEPEQSGAPVALERYVRERYRWFPIRRATVGPDGSVALAVPARAHDLRLRAELLHGAHGWGDAVSQPVVIR